ncbi:MAG: hypothetical protein BECKG1743D_GA0114223_105111, partial [Candidatus Kentron sp. G]
TQGSRFATTLGYDTQPLRGKESGPKTCTKNKKWTDSSIAQPSRNQVENTPKSDTLGRLIKN